MTRKYCPVCLGSGKIPNPKGIGKAIYLPEIICLNCNGEGFIGKDPGKRKEDKMETKYKSSKCGLVIGVDSEADGIRMVCPKCNKIHIFDKLEDKTES